MHPLAFSTRVHALTRLFFIFREFWRGKLGSKGRASPRTTSSAGSPRNSDAQRRAAAVVNFKDLNLSVDDELSEDSGHPDYA